MRRCELELEYERSGAIMDLGCLGAAGFRGWSGGARRSFVITAEAATPGYLPGEPEDGQWQVMIGLHRVPPEGADYRVTIEVSATPGELAPDRAAGAHAAADRPAAAPHPARRSQAASGWPATCTPTRCTRTGS